MAQIFGLRNPTHRRIALVLSLIFPTTLWFTTAQSRLLAEIVSQSDFINASRTDVDVNMALLIGEQIRCFENFSVYDQRLRALSDKIELSGFIVTDSVVGEVTDYSPFSVLRKVHILTSAERNASQVFITRGAGEHRIEWGNMRQHFKVQLAYRDMVEYEKRRNFTFTHVCRLRTDLTFRFEFPFDRLDFSFKGIFMRTELAILGERILFPAVLLDDAAITKFYGKWSTYFPIEPQVVVESDLAAGKFSWICWPNSIFDALTNASRVAENFRRRVNALKDVNVAIFKNEIDAASVPCKASGPDFAFSSERIVLLNILLSNKMELTQRLYAALCVGMSVFMVTVSMWTLEIFFHVHLAKTAGSTVNRIVARRYYGVCGHKGYSFSQNLEDTVRGSTDARFKGYGLDHVHPTRMQNWGLHNSWNRYDDSLLDAFDRVILFKYDDFAPLLARLDQTMPRRVIALADKQYFRTNRPRIAESEKFGMSCTISNMSEYLMRKWSHYRL
ncbi:hypothetical protein BE221DRAFT_143014 [Ostreococcus tauri]|uniref:Uncharacterized protein n=1 Tax=Ostreococcus tauri TaxID=70448 RepID=A0A1Y5I0I4_OSTTA|nr:hypothetical protein BE221DRAFT_143014 [Ostreococcus tauri]